MKAIILTKTLEEKSKKEIIQDYIELYKEKEKLERELKKYKNSNTPSSQNKFDNPKAQGFAVGRKAGKKTGHKGKTRAKEKFAIPIEVSADRNPRNGNKNIKETGYVHEVTINDFEIKKIVKKYICKEYVDLETGELFIAKHSDMPSRGIFGKNVLAFANFLRFKCRVPFNKIASTFTDAFDIPMTAPTAMDVCNRVSDKVSPKYEELKEVVRKERVVNADETGAKKNGVPGWLWGFFSLSIALFVFNTQRGGDILERILGNDFKGLLGCDGWATYGTYSRKHQILLQRCWAHLIREVKFIAKQNSELKDAYFWIQDIFKKLRKARRLKTRRLRKQKHKELVKELDMWLQVYRPYNGMKDIITKVKNGKEFWFTCVLYPEIEPTNNRAERGVRTWVVLRKIIGCLRSDQGERTTEIMLSLFSTWDLRKLNSYEQLKALL